jgi:hypothetical protein
MFPILLRTWWVDEGKVHLLGLDCRRWVKNEVAIENYRADEIYVQISQTDFDTVKPMENRLPQGSRDERGHKARTMTQNHGVGIPCWNNRADSHKQTTFRPFEATSKYQLNPSSRVHVVHDDGSVSTGVYHAGWDTIQYR